MKLEDPQPLHRLAGLAENTCANLGLVPVSRVPISAVGGPSSYANRPYRKRQGRALFRIPFLNASKSAIASSTNAKGRKEALVLFPVRRLNAYRVHKAWESPDHEKAS